MNMRMGSVMACVAGGVVWVGVAGGCREKAQAAKVAAAAPDEHGHEHAEGDGHDHGNGGDGHEGHDHGHGDEHASEVRLTEEAVARYGVVVENAVKRGLRERLVVTGRVEFDGDRVAHVGTLLAGRVVELPARLGQDVKAGDVLCVIESAELGAAQLELVERRAQQRVSGPRMELARGAWERAKALHEKSQGTALAEVQRREMEYKGAQAEAALAEAGVAAAQGRLRMLGLSEERVRAVAESGEVSALLEVRAAIAGRVVEREVTLGEVVGPEHGELMVVADVSWVWVVAEVPEAAVARVAVGATGWVRAGAVDGSAVEGKVGLVGATVEEASRTCRVRLEMEAGALKPGMFAQVEIEVGEAGEKIVAVPLGAVMTVEGKAVVFVPVAGEPDTFTVRAVEVGRAVGGMVPIVSGLGEGEEFVSAGAFVLKAEFGKGSAAHGH